MDRVGLRARGLSILGVSICVLMLTGVSCGGADAMAAVSKSVSTTYEVSGTVWCDDDDNGEWSDGDHFMTYWPVFYKIEGDSTIHAAFTNGLGKYSFTHDAGLYADVWLIPGTYQPHWLYYYVDTSGTIEWENENPVVRVPEDESCPLSFVGSDYLHQ